MSQSSNDRPKLANPSASRTSHRLLPSRRRRSSGQSRHTHPHRNLSSARRRRWSPRRRRRAHRRLPQAHTTPDHRHHQDPRPKRRRLHHSRLPLCEGDQRRRSRHYRPRLHRSPPHLRRTLARTHLPHPRRTQPPRPGRHRHPRRCPRSRARRSRRCRHNPLRIHRRDSQHPHTFMAAHPIHPHALDNTRRRRGPHHAPRGGTPGPRTRRHRHSSGVRHHSPRDHHRTFCQGSRNPAEFKA